MVITGLIDNGVLFPCKVVIKAMNLSTKTPKKKNKDYCSRSGNEMTILSRHSIITNADTTISHAMYLTDTTYYPQRSCHGITPVSNSSRFSYRSLVNFPSNSPVFYHVTADHSKAVRLLWFLRIKCFQYGHLYGCQLLLSVLFCNLKSKVSVIIYLGC